MTPADNDTSLLIEIVGDLKDRVDGLEERNRSPQLAPGNHVGQAWSPCESREEVHFYANLSELT